MTFFHTLIAEREKGRLQTEIQRVNKEIDILTERRNMYEVSCFCFNLS